MHIIHHINGRAALLKVSVSDEIIFREIELKVLAVVEQLRAAGAPLSEFEWSRKPRDSQITKLMAKRSTLAANIYDKLRFRLIVPAYEDLVPMLATLTRQLIPFNYVVPGESVNQLVDLRSVVAQHARTGIAASAAPAELPYNEFSGPEYRIVNFVADLPLRLERLLPRAELSPELSHVVFVLTEFQVCDKATAQKNESGESSHEAYKARQHERVRLRLFRDKDDPLLPTKYIEANGLRFAYLEHGTGPLVLLLHGFPDTAHTWDHVRPLIAAKGYRTVSPWTRGYAPTAIPDRDTDLETLSRDALALIDALGEESAIIVGHDFGAATGYGASSLEPAKVSKLFTIGIPHPATLRATPAKMWGARHFMFYKMPGASRRFAANDFAALPRIYKRWSPAWTPPQDEFTGVRAAFALPASLQAAFGYYRELRFRPEWFMRQKISVPTVVFAGTDDPMLQPADYRRAQRMFTGSYDVVEMGGGHFMHREHPEEFAEKLLARL